MKTTFHYLLILLINLSVCRLFAQSPYELKNQKEFTILGTGLVTAGAGLFFKSKTPVFTAEELGTLDVHQINAFDRVATNHFSLKAHHTSDYFWYGSNALPLFLLAGKKSRKEFGKIMTLYAETALLTAGLTLLTKYTVQRARPFNYDPNTSFEKKTSSNAKASFFSGHTSFCAANIFFTAKVFSDYYPDSKWKPLIWTAAATIPAITGYLRVRGGRHYPTDVLAGYAVGATIGYFIPHLHRNRIRNKNITLNMGYKNLQLDWKF